MKKNEKRKIVFYDGDCPFCNRIVQFILKKNKDRSIFFASIQSDFAQTFLGESPVNLSTFYFYDDYYLFSKSAAALRLCRYLSFPYSWMRMFFIIPVCFRDRGYDFVAKRRQSISKSFCLNIMEEENHRFIN